MRIPVLIERVLKLGVTSFFFFFFFFLQALVSMRVLGVGVLVQLNIIDSQPLRLAVNVLQHLSLIAEYPC